MEAVSHYSDPDGEFEIGLPAGWSAEADSEEGGVEVSALEGVGVLHLLAFPHPSDGPSDPAEELYTFLHEQGVELEEDEVEDIDLGGEAEMAVCEYIGEDESEDEADGEPTFWMIGVAIAPGQLVFASYSCPAGEEEAERDTVREILATLHFTLSPRGKG